VGKFDGRKYDCEDLGWLEGTVDRITELLTEKIQTVQLELSMDYNPNG
jgi:hypothetical protein